jgi:outer membrane lipoprotein LolB
LLPRYTFLAVVLLAMSACSRYGQLADETTAEGLWAEQQAVAAEVTQWNLYARGALRLEGEAYNIGIRWQRYADGRFVMLLEAPFGQGVLRISATGPEQYSLRLPDGQLFENSSAEALLLDVAGWSLPIDGLDYWVRGLPHPDSVHSLRLDSAGRAQSIRQDSWDIVYRDYFSKLDEPSLPRRFSLTNDKVTLKLVIERWQQAPAAAASDADLFPVFD